MISFIIPAHNEEALLGRTIQAAHETAQELGVAYEIIVVDDASTDATPDIARANHAPVVAVNFRQIAPTRNAGGRAAKGERLFFVDADTLVNARAVSEAMKSMDRRAAGGGALTAFEGATPLYIRLITFVGIIPAKLSGFCGGAFMFCTREAFHASGGFDERMFWAEEGSFAIRLKRFGRFVVIWHRVLTSARRFENLSGSTLLTTASRFIRQPRRMFTSRASVENIWYDSNRKPKENIANPSKPRLVNGLLLLATLSLLTAPFLQFVPWSLTPVATTLGKVRLVHAFFVTHVGLILWPICVVLFWNLFRQKFSFEWVRLIALVAFCGWQGWAATRGVVSLWTRLFHSVTS